MPKKKLLPVATIPTLEALLEAGAHFGHMRSRRHPRMRPFIFTVRNRVTVINLEETQRQLMVAQAFLSAVAERGQVLFVGTKRQAKQAVKETAEAAHQPYVTERWLGGTLTNVEIILKNIEALKRLESETGVSRTKKEQLDVDRRLNKLRLRLGGLLFLESHATATGLPKLSIAAMILVDVRRERTALLEARKSGIPIVAIIDTDSDPNLVDYPIVMNDDSQAAIALIMSALSEAVAAGAKKRALPEPAK